MSDNDKIVWEELRAGHRWVDYTEEEREHIRNSTVPVRTVTVAEIKAIWGEDKATGGR